MEQIHWLNTLSTSNQNYCIFCGDGFFNNCHQVQSVAKMCSWFVKFVVDIWCFTVGEETSTIMESFVCKKRAE
jgi:hypothetical protein